VSGRLRSALILGSGARVNMHEAFMGSGYRERMNMTSWGYRQ
jgi:hypothetical protein